MLPDYQVLPISDLLILLEKNGKDPGRKFDWQLRTNAAYAYRLKDESIILLPNHRDPNKNGLLIRNEETLAKMITADHFPIESIGDDIYEKLQDEIQYIINKDMEFFQNYLNRRLRLNYSIINKEIVLAYYHGIMSLRKKKKMVESDFLALTVILGEELRNSRNGKWILLKKYGPFNPYWTPAIIDNHSNIMFITDWLSFSIKHRDVNLNYWYERCEKGSDFKTYQYPYQERLKIIE